MKRLGILISGRGSNMQALVKACQTGVLQGLYEPVLVFSNHHDAAGLQWAKSQGLEVESLEVEGRKRIAYDRVLLEKLRPHRLDCVALAGFLRVLGSEFIEAYRNRIFNIHPADTALHQGLGGYEWAWKQGLKQTKITVHRVDEGLDTGTVILQETVDLQGVTSLQELEARGLVVEHRLYPLALQRVHSGL